MNFKPYKDAIETIEDATFMSGDVQGETDDWIIIVSHHDGHMNTYMGSVAKTPEQVKAEVIAYHASLHVEGNDDGVDQ